MLAGFAPQPPAVTSQNAVQFRPRKYSTVTWAHAQDVAEILDPSYIARMQDERLMHNDKDFLIFRPFQNMVQTSPVSGDSLNPVFGICHPCNAIFIGEMLFSQLHPLLSADQEPKKLSLWILLLQMLWNSCFLVALFRKFSSPTDCLYPVLCLLCSGVCLHPSYF